MQQPRTQLVGYRSALVTPDVAESLRLLEVRGAQVPGLRIRFDGTSGKAASWAGVKEDPGPTQCGPLFSMRPAGREVRLRLSFNTPQHSDPVLAKHREIEILWGLAIPLGFVPWTRYPIPGSGDDVFHVLGPWQGLYDSLCGEGRGDLAWPSVCCAAQVDVGRWGGDRPIERFVQAQMHRLGVPVGPLDGVISERTQDGLRALGLGGMRLEEAAEALRKMESPAPSGEARRIGHVVIPGRVQAVAHGKVTASKTPHGYALTIDGPGRVVVDVGGDG